MSIVETTDGLVCASIGRGVNGIWRTSHGFASGSLRPFGSVIITTDENLNTATYLEERGIRYSVTYLKRNNTFPFKPFRLEFSLNAFLDFRL